MKPKHRDDFVAGIRFKIKPNPTTFRVVKIENDMVHYSIVKDNGLLESVVNWNVAESLIACMVELL